MSNGNGNGKALTTGIIPRNYYQHRNKLKHEKLTTQNTTTEH